MSKMTIDSGFPTPLVLRNLEFDTLKLLHTAKQVRELSYTVAKDAQRAYQYITNWNIKTIVDFESCFVSRYESKTVKVWMGGTAEAEKPIVQKKKGKRLVKDTNHCVRFSYYFAVVNHAKDPAEVLRKVHFDYVPQNSERSVHHPIFHLQFCGALTPRMKTDGMTKACIQRLYPEISIPRIPFYPMTLALLLNHIFGELSEDKNCRAIKETSEWRNLVRENEEKVLKPYYDVCQQHFEGAGLEGRGALFADYCYGL